MKVLHVIAELEPRGGGVSQAVRTIINGLNRGGVHSEVVSLDAPDAPFLKKDSFTTHALGPKKSQWSYSSKLVSWLVKNVCQFDVVLLHGLWLYPGYAVHKAIQICKKQQLTGAVPRFFIMPHGMLDPWFQRVPNRKIKAFRNWAYWKLIESNIVSEADGLLFTCEAELQLAREPFRPYKPQNEIVVGLGVDEPPPYTLTMQEIFLQKCPALTNVPYFLFLSRIHEKKGVDLLIKAYYKLVQKFLAVESETSLERSSKAEVNSLKVKVPKLIIAGPGLETPYGEQMQKLVSQQPVLSKLIFFPGMLTGDAKWGAFYGCEAFVLPSHQENFGIAVVEALSCGKPVLISDQVNIWREIETAGSGIIAADSQEGTEQMLNDWLNLSVEEKQAIKQKTKNSYWKYFAVESAAEKLLTAIK